MDVEVEKDDLSQKFLTSLAPEWLMHTIVWRNKNDLDTMSLDDLYNHLKSAEHPEVRKEEGRKAIDKEDHALVAVREAPTEFALMANTESKTYYWENCFSILNIEEAGNTRSSLSADTFGNNGVDESETSSLETPAKEVVDNGIGSTLIFLVGHGTVSEVVIGLLEGFQEGDMVYALSRVLEQKSLEKRVDSGSGR
nr:ribonuclease H-like domain-containing protein [Tanacetum cinerariifolium]